MHFNENCRVRLRLVLLFANLSRVFDQLTCFRAALMRHQPFGDGFTWVDCAQPQPDDARLDQEPSFGGKLVVRAVAVGGATFIQNAEADRCRLLRGRLSTAPPLRTDRVANDQARDSRCCRPGHSFQKSRDSPFNLITDHPRLADRRGISALHAISLGFRGVPSNETDSCGLRVLTLRLVRRIAQEASQPSRIEQIRPRITHEDCVTRCKKCGSGKNPRCLKYFCTG